MINQAAGGDLRTLTPEDALELFAEMANKTRSWSRQQPPSSKYGSDTHYDSRAISVDAPKDSSTYGKKPKLPGHRDEDDPMFALLMSKIDAMASQVSNLSMPKHPSKVQSSHVGNPQVASIYCCECCGGQGHDVSACPSATLELGQGDEVSFAQGQGFHGNFSL